MYNVGAKFYNVMFDKDIQVNLVMSNLPISNTRAMSK